MDKDTLKAVGIGLGIVAALLIGIPMVYGWYLIYSGEAYDDMPTPEEFQQQYMEQQRQFDEEWNEYRNEREQQRR